MDTTNHKRELEILGWCFDLLRAGQFNGAWAEKLYPAQMYLKSLHSNLEAEIARVASIPEAASKPVESTPSAVEQQSTNSADAVASSTH